jgi:hypothetical protein
MYILLGYVAAVGGCAASHIYFVPGCDEGLAMPYQRQECRTCVEMPIPHEFLPDNPDGTRCVRR